MKAWISSFFNLLFPPSCIVCQRATGGNNEILCLRCLLNLPRTNCHLYPDNWVEKSFWGKFSLGRATSFFYYQQGSDYKALLYQLKYKGEKEVGRYMGQLIATELMASHFFEGMQVIIPVPLHPKKFKKRGYNQSEWIAKGVSQITGIPIDTNSVIRLKNTETQTQKSRLERWENVENIFALREGVAERMSGKHILLIDDVLTTGATLTACASVFNEIENIRISVLTMAAAQI